MHARDDAQRPPTRRLHRRIERADAPAAHAMGDAVAEREEPESERPMWPGNGWLQASGAYPRIGGGEKQMCRSVVSPSTRCDQSERAAQRSFMTPSASPITVTPRVYSTRGGVMRLNRSLLVTMATIASTGATALLGCAYRTVDQDGSARPRGPPRHLGDRGGRVGFPRAPCARPQLSRPSLRKSPAPAGCRAAPR